MDTLQGPPGRPGSRSRSSYDDLVHSDIGCIFIEFLGHFYTGGHMDKSDSNISASYERDNKMLDWL